MFLVSSTSFISFIVNESLVLKHTYTHAQTTGPKQNHLCESPTPAKQDLMPNQLHFEPSQECDF